MKQILFTIMTALLFMGCSKEGEEHQDVSKDFALSKAEITLIVDDETRIEIVGVNIDECDVYSEDDFIAYAIKYNGKIDVEADHAGETNVIVKHKDIQKVCKIIVKPSIDFISSTVTDFGIKKSDLKERVEKPYDRYENNPQTNSTDVTYTRSGYKITNSYFFNDSGLIGVKKTIIASGSDTQVLLNITKSMNDRAKYVSHSSSTINSYPKSYEESYIYTHPNKYYAVYEQIRYDILYETGTRPLTRNYIYFAKDLEDAKNHKFAL